MEMSVLELSCRPERSAMLAPSGERVDATSRQPRRGIWRGHGGGPAGPGVPRPAPSFFCTRRGRPCTAAPPGATPGPCRSAAAVAASQDATVRRGAASLGRHTLRAAASAVSSPSSTDVDVVVIGAGVAVPPA
eukprot:365513-Chlamydomonas_euryale.AAC.3